MPSFYASKPNCYKLLTVMGAKVTVVVFTYFHPATISFKCSITETILNISGKSPNIQFLFLFSLLLVLHDFR